MQYEHTQRGWWHFVILAVAAMVLPTPWLEVERPPPVVVDLAVVAVLLLAAAMFASLTVRDEGERLAARFGPLRVFRKRIRYADITSVEPGLTTILDGWGIHFIPGRGWTYNVWGFYCVKLTLANKTIRLGTDDRENLVKFLEQKIAALQPSHLP